MKSWLREQTLNILGSLTKPSKRTHFLNGHFVCADTIPFQEQQIVFDGFIRALKKRVSLVDPITALENLHQEKETLVCLTFDDGYAESLTAIAPVLEANGTKGLFFVNPEFIGLTDEAASQVMKTHFKSAYVKNFLTHAELVEINQRGHFIGSHTESHVRLSTVLDIERLHREIVLSKEHIETITCKPCDWFAFPFGAASDIHENALQIALSNYRYVFSSVKGKDLFSFNKRVVNRRHFEGNWPINHINFFLSGRS